MDAGERHEAVRAIAKDGDPDRYAASLFAPVPVRDRLIALYAFNVELAHAAERVEEPQLGEIRLQWWRETLARDLGAETTGHPVADAMAETARASALPTQLLNQLIDARHFDISVKIMPDAEALQDYLDQTAVSLFRLAAQIAGKGAESPETEAAARSAGTAYGLTGLMRALPIHAALGRVDIPNDLLHRHGTSVEDVLAGRTNPGLLAALAELRGEAQEALEHARRDVALLPVEARRAFLPLALVEPYLALLRGRREPLRSVVEMSPLHRLWRLGTYRFR